MSPTPRPNVLAVRAVMDCTYPHPFEPPGYFPLQVFPPDVRAYIAASADSARIPDAMVALPFLTFAGATIGNQLRFDVGNGWIEYPALWIALIALTGAGKTPGISWARAPLDQLQEDAWTSRRKDGPSLDRFFATDITIEALAHDLMHNPGIVIVRDELFGFLSTMSQYRAGASLSTQQFLSLWSSHPLAISRRRIASAYVKTPVVGICGGIQPLLWTQFRKKQTDGMVERIVPFVVGLPRDYWNESDALAPRPPDLPAMVERFRRLRAIAPGGLTVTRSPEAGMVWADWFNTNLQRSLAASILHIGYYQKLPSQVARTALILHALWHPDRPATPLAQETMRFATLLASSIAPTFTARWPSSVSPNRSPHRIPPLANGSCGSSPSTPPTTVG